MSKNIILGRGQQFLAISLSVVLSLLVVWGAVSGATTISTNISTGGTLTVSDASTLTGLSTHTGGALLVASSTAVGKFQVNGALNASSTMHVAGAARFDSGVGLGAENTVAKTLLVSALTSDPTASEGRLYYNSTEKLFKFYDGTQWALIASSTAGAGLVSSGDRVQLSSLAEGYLTIGTTTNYLQSSMLTLQGTSTASIPLTIYATGSQSTNLLQIMGQNAVSELFVIDAAGHASGSQLTLSENLLVTASSTFNSTLDVSGNLSTKGTSAFTGLSTHTGGALLVASSTAVANFTVAGELHASSTLAVTGAATFNNSLTTATSTATTTLAVRADSNGATGGEGGCLQLTAQNGQLYRMYITAADATVFATTTGRGSGTQVSAVWEAGACQ